MTAVLLVALAGVVGWISALLVQKKKAEIEVQKMKVKEVTSDAKKIVDSKSDSTLVDDFNGHYKDDGS